MTPTQESAIDELRAAGYALIIWSPEELGDADRDTVEARGIEDTAEVISQLGGPNHIGGEGFYWTITYGGGPDTPVWYFDVYDEYRAALDFLKDLGEGYSDYTVGAAQELPEDELVSDFAEFMLYVQLDVEAANDDAARAVVQAWQERLRQ